MACSMRALIGPENITRVSVPASATTKYVRNFLLRCGSASWNLLLRALTGLCNETNDPFGSMLSTRRKPNTMLSVRRNIKGMSLGLMKACPSSKGCVLKRTRMPQAVQLLNQRFVSQYRHRPVNWNVMKYEKCQRSGVNICGNRL